MAPLGGFLARLFGPRPAAPEPGSLVEELWVAELSGPGSGRFLEAEEPGYSAAYPAPGRDRGAGLELRLGRTDLFAWTEAPLYRHADFVLEGEFELRPGRTHAACGFLFRYQDERNFYAALVSDRGYFRLDFVFNGRPRPLVAWTECPRPLEPGPEGLSFSLRIIARGGHFTLIVDEAWAAEAVDEGFRAGLPAFAAQNYGLKREAAESASDGVDRPGADGGERPPAGDLVAILRSCFVESRPLEVETWYYRWNYYLVPGDAARLRLAETFFSMGEYLAAAIQLRKVEKRRALGADEQFLKAEIAIRLELHDEAVAALDACLALEPGRREAAEEKANLLHLRGRYAELKELLERYEPLVPGNARLLGLRGHALFALGDYAGAAAAYGAAADLDRDQALFRMNEARAWDQARRKPEAVAAYLKAARLFFLQEADDDLALALHRLVALKARGNEAREIKAKDLYRRGEREAAGRVLLDLASKGSADPAVHYLAGLVLAERGDRAASLERLARARDLAPDYPLFAFRYAEALFLSGADAGAAIARALELAPEEGWTLNLAGQEALARGDLPAARAFAEAARRALPGVPEPAMNLAEIESRAGRTEEALAALEPFRDRAACRNLAGNVHARAAGTGAARDDAKGGDGAGGEARAADAREARLELAAREYAAAAALEPRAAEYRSNLAAAYLELERYSDAEREIGRALDLGPDARSCLLAGNLASIYGDRPRAEAAYRLGLESSPNDGALLLALGRHYLAEGSIKKAEESARRLEKSDPERAARLSDSIRDATTEALACARCGRLWRVPRSLPAMSRANVRAMPPDDSPAGSCPSCGRVYCIACAKPHLVDSRFTCPGCGEALKLADDRLRWLVLEHLKRAE